MSQFPSGSRFSLRINNRIAFRGKQYLHPASLAMFLKAPCTRGNEVWEKRGRRDRLGGLRGGKIDFS